jgi:hypothetical protein
MNSSWSKRCEKEIGRSVGNHGGFIPGSVTSIVNVKMIKPFYSFKPDGMLDLCKNIDCGLSCGLISFLCR